MQRTGLAISFVSLVLAGCSDDTTEKTDAAIADAVVDKSHVDGPGADAIGFQDVGTDSAPVTKVTVEGAVFDPFASGDHPGIKVYEVGSSPENATTTDANSQYSLKVPAGQPVTLRIDPNSYLSFQASLVLSDDATVDLLLFSESFFTAKATEAGLPTIDPAKGIVVVFLGEDAAVGQGVSLSATNGGSFTLDDQGKATATDKLLANHQPALVFINVTLGKTQLSFSPAGKCSVGQSIDHPVDAKTVSIVSPVCVP